MPSAPSTDPAVDVHDTHPVRPPRLPKRPVHGVLLLDKPKGLSSNDALQAVRRLLRAEKAGHTGTLDPMATGLLPLCFGAATKYSQISLEADKAYEAVVQLGVRTDSGDAEGAVIQTTDVVVQAQGLEAALESLRGPIIQVPPMHSALKKDGRPLYEYARQGLEVERAGREVTIHHLHAQWADEAHHRLMLSVRCSKGTYIRTLADDLGQRLGCGGHLVALRRTASGPLSIGQAITLEALQALNDEERLARLMPVDALLGHWPAVHLAAEEAGRFLTGLRRRVPAQADPGTERSVRVYGPPSTHPVLLGSAHIRGGELIPDRLLSPLEIQALQAA